MLIKQEESVNHTVLIFFPHNTPLIYNSSSENIIVMAHELDHALHNTALQAPFSDIGNSQMVVIEKLSGIFIKVTDNLHQILDPPQQKPVTNSATIPHKLCPTLVKPISLENPNIIEDYDGNSPTYIQCNVHVPPSGPHIILPDVPVPPPKLCPAQPPRVDTGVPSSNLRSSCKKNIVPNFALAAKFQQVREANAVTHQIYGVSQEYRPLTRCLYSWATPYI